MYCVGRPGACLIVFFCGLRMVKKRLLAGEKRKREKEEAAAESLRGRRWFEKKMLRTFLHG